MLEIFQIIALVLLIGAGIGLGGILASYIPVSDKKREKLRKIMRKE